MWSHLKCCAAGALKYLLYVFKSSAAARCLELKAAAASAVRALATCPWQLCAKTSMREGMQLCADGDPYTPCSDLIDMSSSWSVLIELLSPFESELVDVVNAIVFLSSSPCRCCGVEVSLSPCYISSVQFLSGGNRAARSRCEKTRWRWQI